MWFGWFLRRRPERPELSDEKQTRLVDRMLKRPERMNEGQ